MISDAFYPRQIQTCYGEKLLGLTVVETEPGLFETWDSDLT